MSTVNQKRRLHWLMQSGLFVVLVVVFAGLLGYLAWEKRIQWDVSQNAHNSLTQTSIDILNKMNGPIAATIDKIAQATAAGFNRQLECDLYRLHQFFASACPESTGGSHGRNAGAKKRFTSVNVSYPYDNAAVHQYFLDARAPPPRPPIQQWSGECFREWFGSELRQQRMLHDIGLSPEHRAKTSRITQAQNHTIIQNQIDMVMLSRRGYRRGRQQPQASGHSEMQD